MHKITTHKMEARADGRTVILNLQVTSDYHQEEDLPPISLTLPVSPEKLVSLAEQLRLYASHRWRRIVPFIYIDCPHLFVDDTRI